MHRRNFLLYSGLVAGGSLLFRKSALASLFDTAEFKIRMLRNNVGIFTERGGTIGFMIGEGGIVVIDSQFPEPAQHLIEELKKKSNKPFKFLLNTHHHGDHSSGNITFKDLVEHVIAHENALINMKTVAEKNNSLDKVLLPDQTFTRELELKVDDDKIRGGFFGAAHTNGDALYHFEDSNIMHVGDLMFNKRHPYVDRSAGANMNNWINYLDWIYKKADKDTIIIFGHALNPGEETGSREDLKLFQDYLDKVLKFAEQEIRKGVSKEEFIKNTSIPGNTLWSGSGIERPLTAAYEEISSAGQ